MSDDTYQGWTNRETWAANLWLANDEGLCSMVNEWRDEIVGHDDDPSDEVADRLGMRIRDFFDELADGEFGEINAEARTMLDEIGSRWRVDWTEIAATWMED
jgi:hypothetical protein